MLPVGRRAQSLDEEMPDVWQNCEHHNWWSLSDTFVSGDLHVCRGWHSNGPRRARGLLGISWKAVFCTHIHIACWWLLCEQILPWPASWCFCGRSCVFLSHQRTASKKGTKQNWEQVHPLSGQNSTNPNHFYWMYHAIYSAPAKYDVFILFLIIVSIIVELSVSLGLHSCFTWCKQMTEAVCFFSQHHIHHAPGTAFT